MGKGPDVQPRNYYNETAGTLQAQVDLAPKVYENEAKYGSLYSLLGLKQLETSLNGADGQRGLTDILENDLYPSMSRIQGKADSAQREADISSIETLGPRAIAALRASNPEQAALLSKLTQQAQSGLDEESGLSAGTMREIQQATRSAQAARGLGYGNTDAFNEALNVGTAADSRRRQNQAFAANMVNLQQATSGDPWMAILGRSSGATGLASGAMAQGNQISNTSPNLFNPESGYASDLYNTNYNGAVAQSNSSNNMFSGILGGVLGAAGSIGGGWLAGRGKG